MRYYLCAGMRGGGAIGCLEHVLVHGSSDTPAQYLNKHSPPPPATHTGIPCASAFFRGDETKSVSVEVRPNNCAVWSITVLWRRRRMLRLLKLISTYTVEYVLLLLLLLSRGRVVVDFKVRDRRD
jgi:hypothetical protein